MSIVPKVMKLKIEDIAATRSFVFVWVGSGEGLDAGREVRTYVLVYSLCGTCVQWPLS